MMRILYMLLALTIFAADGDDEGRAGNRLYAEEQYGRAAEAYERGLAALSENAPRMLRYGLLNNLGAALLKSGDAEAAGETFARALGFAPDPPDVARTSYNAGNAAYASADLEKALDHYRRSLLSEPENVDAKFNYEFVKRQLDRSQQNQQNQSGPRNEENEDDSGQDEQQSGSQDQQEDQQEDQSQNQDEEAQGGGPDEQEPAEQQNEQPDGRSEAQPSGSQMSQEQAQQILDALRSEEEQLLREVQRPKSRPRQVEKDW